MTGLDNDKVVLFWSKIAEQKSQTLEARPGFVEFCSIKEVSPESAMLKCISTQDGKTFLVGYS